MFLPLNDIKSKYQCPALAIAHGPSLTPFISKLPNFRELNFKLFGCNDWHKIYSTVPDYWLMANTENTCYTDKELLNKYQIPFVYADSVDLTDRNWIKDNLTCPVLPYDQRHFNGKTCNELLNSEKRSLGGYTVNGKCCNHIIPGRLTIQEELQQLAYFPYHYSSGSTAFLHSITLAILCGCNPIYIIGLDLEYSKGYAGNKQIEQVRWKELDNYRQEILDDLSIIRDSAYNIGVDLINLNKNSIFNTIEIGESPC
jgi:hypothetical protein